jgi:hypothetical protein
LLVRLGRPCCAVPANDLPFSREGSKSSSWWCVVGCHLCASEGPAAQCRRTTSPSLERGRSQVVDGVRRVLVTEGGIRASPLGSKFSSRGGFYSCGIWIRSVSVFGGRPLLAWMGKPAFGRTALVCACGETGPQVCRGSVALQPVSRDTAETQVIRPGWACPGCSRMGGRSVPWRKTSPLGSRLGSLPEGAPLRCCGLGVRSL